MKFQAPMRKALCAAQTPGCCYYLERKENVYSIWGRSQCMVPDLMALGGWRQSEYEERKQMSENARSPARRIEETSEEDIRNCQHRDRFCTLSYPTKRAGRRNRPQHHRLR